MSLTEKQLSLCDESKWDFSDLKALFLNCTLKRSPELSHTEGLIAISRAIMEKNGVSVELLRPVDFEIAYGVYPDMKQHGWKGDDWPELRGRIVPNRSRALCRREHIRGCRRVSSAVRPREERRSLFDAEASELQGAGLLESRHRFQPQLAGEVRHLLRRDRKKQGGQDRQHPGE